MTEKATIIKIENESVTVRLGNRPECAGCKSCVCKPYNNSVIKTKLNAKVGDTAVINIPDKNRIIAPLVLFLLPLAFMLSGVFIGYKVFTNQGLVLTLGAVFLAVSFGIIALVNFLINKNIKSQITITEIIGENK